MFSWKSLLKQMLPFTIGLFIGGGLTKNKYVFSIFLSFFLIMLIKKALMSATSKDKKKKGKKTKVIEIRDKLFEWYIGQVVNGIELGNKLFDKGYTIWTFIFNIFLLCSSLYLFYKGIYLWSAICFVSLQLFIVQNQILRRLNENELDEDD